jgi:putative acetyltransferase
MLTRKLRLRRARDTDVADLAALYADSIRRLGPEYYRPEAVEAWAAHALSHQFRDFILTNQALIAEDSTGTAGFGSIDGSGRIASLYVRPDRSRQGVGSTLLAALLDIGRAEGLGEFRAEASELSKPLFERFGFSVVASEVVEREGIPIERYRMRLA